MTRGMSVQATNEARTKLAAELPRGNTGRREQRGMLHWRARRSDCTEMLAKPTRRPSSQLLPHETLGSARYKPLP